MANIFDEYGVNDDMRVDGRVLSAEEGFQDVQENVAVACVQSTFDKLAVVIENVKEFIEVAKRRAVGFDVSSINGSLKENFKKLVYTEEYEKDIKVLEDRVFRRFENAMNVVDGFISGELRYYSLDEYSSIAEEIDSYFSMGYSEWLEDLDLNIQDISNEMAYNDKYVFGYYTPYKETLTEEEVFKQSLCDDGLKFSPRIRKSMEELRWIVADINNVITSINKINNNDYSDEPGGEE